MLEFFASLALAVVVGFLIVRAWHQKDLLEDLPPAAGERGAGRLPHVAVVVPARNEAENIGLCLKSLAEQDYPGGRFRIIAVDDGSSDDTPRIIAEMARENPAISLFHSPPLAEGWTGKCQAC